MTAPGDPLTSPLAFVVGEVEGHVAEAGWDQPPQLFALVQTEALLRAEPQLAQSMGLLPGDPSSLTPVAQDPLGEGPLDEQLASLVFGADVLGVVLAHEVLVLPPSAEAALTEAALPEAGLTEDGLPEDVAAVVAAHPERREVRMVVGVTRGGTTSCVLRLRGDGEQPDERVTGPDLAPALSAALLATLED